MQNAVIAKLYSGRGRSLSGGANIQILFLVACCDDLRPLGMVNRKIKDSQISTSSEGTRHTKRMARLNSTEIHAGWSSAGGDTEPWLQVDFLQFAKIVQILTQGRRIDPRKYVKKFSVSYSFDGLAFTIYKEYGSKKVRTRNMSLPNALNTKATMCRVCTQKLTYRTLKLE